MPSTVLPDFRVVVRELSALVFPHARAGVTPQDAWPTLDLNEVDAPRRQDEKVDFVDATIVRDEVEVRPSAVRILAAGTADE